MVDGNHLSCTQCSKNFNEDKYYQLHFLEACAHILCKACFTTVVQESYPDRQRAQCPECSDQITDYEIKNIIGAENFEILQKQILMKFISEDQSLVTCQCGNVMEVVQGEIDYTAKDDQGIKLSTEAVEHMSKFRVRCAACQQNFCTFCNTQPYHVGKICEEFKAFTESTKCRFCGDEIIGEGADVLKDVCGKQE